MGFIISTKRISKSKKIGSCYLRGNYKEEGNNIIISKGSFVADNAEVLKGGEIIKITYDKEGKINIKNDIYGRETVYIYNKNNIIISDDFWDILDIIKPKKEDLDLQVIKESIFMISPMHDGTFIRNLTKVPASTNMTIDLKKKKIDTTTHWSYKINTTKATIDEKVNELERAIIRTIGDIRRFYSEEIVFGIGISGGLDSRIIAHYAKKGGLKLRSFIIGEKRPHKALLSRDHVNARRIARELHIPHKEVKYNANTYHFKNRKDVQDNPTGFSQIFKYVKKGIPKFDILLTGSGDMYVGTKIRDNINHLSEEQFMNEILLRRTLIAPPPSNIRRLLDILGIWKVHKKIRPIGTLLTEEDLQNIKDRLRLQIKKSDSRTNFEKYQDFVIKVQGSPNKHGAFESLCNDKKQHTIYSYRILQQAIRWEYDDLRNRNLLKELLKKKIPHLADIPLQNWEPSPSKSNKPIARVFALMEFVSRGWGVMRYPIWSKQRKFKRFAKKVLARPNPVFEEHFDKREILTAFRKKRIDTRSFEQFVKVKTILDRLFI